MRNTHYLLALLATSTLAGTAFAQAAEPSAPTAAGTRGDVDGPNSPSAAPSAAPAADDAPVVAEQVAVPTPQDSAAQMEFLRAQVEALQTQLEALKKQVSTTAPSWKGAPQFSYDNGFTFKPKGFIQFDSGYIEREVDHRSFQKLGTGYRARRIVFGAEGTLPGGFGYNVELNLAQGTVDYEDIFLSYQPKGSPLTIRVGNTYPLSSLDTMTSSRLGSFLERATFTEAFGENRRLGVAVGLVDPNDRYTLTGGFYGQEINNANDGDTRTGWQASVRGTFSPQFGDTRVHFGANYQHRIFQQDAQQNQYRARPLTQITGLRLIDTGNIAAKGDDILGGEIAAVHGPIHVVGEAQKLWVHGYQPGTIFDRNDASTGTFYVGDPDFFSAYGEIGFFLTGETRGYKGGRWDRTKVLHPFDQGGWGAIQINGRIDYTNLNSRVGPGANLTTTANNYFVNGGKQVGYQASVIWNPMDYVRVMLQLAHTDVTGGPRTATAGGGGTFLPATLLLRDSFAGKRIDDRKFGINSLAVRAQIEF